MASDNSRQPHDITYRERDVEKTLDEHESRITTNEGRWLIAKGALAMLALSKGAETAFGAFSSLI